jgi:hypothetical protein
LGETAWVILCARFRARVLICRRCDRGQIYCAGVLSPREVADISLAAFGPT